MVDGELGAPHRATVQGGLPVHHSGHVLASRHSVTKLQPGRAPGELTGGSTRLELRDAVATREYVAAVVDWQSTLHGRTMRGTELAVYHVAAGRVIEAWFYPDDQAAAARFFGAAE